MKKTIIFILTLMFCATNYYGQRTYMELKNVSEVEASLNSDAEESLPLFSPDGRLYFVRTLHESNTGGKLAGQDIWYSQVNGSNWSQPTNSVGALNNVFNNGVVGVADSGKTLYLNGTYSNKYEYQLGVSRATYEEDEGDWGRPRRIRIKGFNPKSPYLTFHVNEQHGIMVMSFGSKNDPKNEDLYVSFREKDYTWSKPKSLGVELNTDSAEFSPFLGDDGKTLYFSSNGHGGIGGVDVFVATRLDDTWQYWSHPSNLGEPINSEAFDAYYTQVGTDAYFSSNRNGKLSDLFYAEYEIVISDDTPIAMGDDEMLKERVFEDEFALMGFLEGLESPNQVTGIRILDNEGEVVREMQADDKGSFQLGGMSQYSKYYLDVDGTVSPDIFIVNSDGDRVYLSQDPNSGTYPFETMKRDIRAVLMADVVVDDGGLKATQFAFDSEGDIPAGSSIYLKDEFDNHQETVVVNRNGEFEFKTLKSGKSYKIEFEEGTLDLNSKVFVVKDGERTEVSGNILKGALFKKVQGALEEVPEELPVATVDEPVAEAVVVSDEENTTFGFEDENAPPEGTTVKLVDDEGNVVEEVTTDDEGLFTFKKLDPDKKYSIQMDDVEDGDKKDFSMFIVSNEGVQRPLAKEVTEGKAFDGAVVAQTEATAEEEEFTFDYQALPPAGSKVYLTDENNNIVDSAYVDSEGNFKFKKLDPSKSYLMRMAADDDYSKGLDFFVLNEEGSKIKVGDEEEAGDAVVATAPEVVKPKMSYDKFAFDAQNKPDPGTKVYLTDEDNNVVDSSFVDPRGNFAFKRLDPSESYMFQVDDEAFDMDNADLFAMENGTKRKLTKLERAYSVASIGQLAEEDSQLDISAFQIEIEDTPEEEAPKQAYLYDEETNTIVDTADIDPETGTFKFTKLTSEKRYSLKFDEEIDMSKAKLYTMDETEEEKTEVESSDEGFAVVTPKVVEKPVEDDVVAVVEEPKEDDKPVVVEEKPKEEKPKEELTDIRGEWVLYFGFNEFLLGPDQIAYLEKEVISTLRKDESIEIIVEGHTDNVGSEEVNYRMAVLRISNVLYHLEMRGVEDTRVTAIPKGEATPVATNDTEEGRSKNRRVEIRIKKG